jgi:mono/diheme cytochrome c family protein
MLLAAFIGFGVTYLALRTDRVTMQEGDSRTHTAASSEATATSGAIDAGAGAGAEKSATLDTAALMARGKQIFTTTCQACHQANGAGIPGAFPPLDGSEWVIGSPKRVAAIILHGVNGKITVKGQDFQGVMPTFKDQFTSEEIAAVATYVRQTFGKTSDTVTPALVDEVKKATQSRSGPWAGGADLNSVKW